MPFVREQSGGTTLEFELISGNEQATVSCQVGDYILVAGSGYNGTSGLAVTGGDIVYDEYNHYSSNYSRQSVIKATSNSVQITRAGGGCILITKIKS